jgi:pilus assembly protein Flp/PilA
MKKLGDLLLKLYVKIKCNQRGATAVEYGIMVALIAAVIIGTVVLLGQKVLGAFSFVESQIPSY